MLGLWKRGAGTPFGSFRTCRGERRTAWSVHPHPWLTCRHVFSPWRNAGAEILYDRRERKAMPGEFVQGCRGGRWVTTLPCSCWFHVGTGNLALFSPPRSSQLPLITYGMEVKVGWVVGFLSLCSTPGYALVPLGHLQRVKKMAAPPVLVQIHGRSSWK